MTGGSLFLPPDAITGFFDGDRGKWGRARRYPPRMKSEKLLAELNRLRQDLDKDPSDLEWFTLHHVFCFVSYKHGEFQAYLDEAIKPGDEVPED